MRKLLRPLGALVLSGLVLVSLSACAMFGQAGSDIVAALQGRSATVTTFATNGNVIDKVHGVSINMVRDTTFDTQSENGSNADSSVVMISVGNSTMRHVGSTMLVTEDGLTTVAQPGSIVLDNKTAAVPWLNTFREANQNLWHGKGKTILIRSQFDVPLAVYAGDEVEVFATTIPKSTLFRIDGKVLIVYRANYTVYDNDLLKR
jgi:hypothetical protein